MSERYELLGHKAALKPESLRLEIECEALRDKLRRLLPLHEDAIDLDSEAILSTSIALHASLQELAGVNKKLNILKNQLGE